MVSRPHPKIRGDPLWDDVIIKELRKTGATQTQEGGVLNQVGREKDDVGRLLVRLQTLVPQEALRCEPHVCRELWEESSQTMN